MADPINLAKRVRAALGKRDDPEIAIERLIRELCESADAKDQEIAALRERVQRMEYRLEVEGYREHCDIPACNCGNQWAHGGHARQRLREISDALEGRDNGTTILDAVKRLVRDEEALREALKDVLAQHRAETRDVEHILRGEGE